jgi:hypothetical protein
MYSLKVFTPGMPTAEVSSTLCVCVDFRIWWKVKLPSVSIEVWMPAAARRLLSGQSSRTDVAESHSIYCFWPHETCVWNIGRP